MTYLDELLDRLAGQVPCAYHDGGPGSTEPTALAAIALAAHGRQVPAARALKWLGGLQAADGSVGPTASQATPGWPTSLAVLAALYANKAGIGAESTGQ